MIHRGISNIPEWQSEYDKSAFLIIYFLPKEGMSSITRERERERERESNEENLNTLKMEWRKEDKRHAHTRLWSGFRMFGGPSSL